MMEYAYWGVCKFFGLVFLLGVILFVVWAVRSLNKKELRKWVIGLLIVGLAGIILSSLLMMSMGKWDKYGKVMDLKFGEDLVEEIEIL